MQAERNDSQDSYVAAHPNELERQLDCLQTSLGVPLGAWLRAKERLAESIHRRVRNEYRPLLDQYSDVDPDRQSHWQDSTDSETRLQAKVVETMDGVEGLLRAANYRRLSPRKLSQAVRTASAWGVKLRIEFREFHRLRVYVRGDGIEQRVRREWYLLFVQRALSVPIYRQMVVLFQVRPPAKATVPRRVELSLRMFKNIPHADLDLLLPGRVRMSLLDRGRIGIPTLWGFAMLASKLARSLWLVALFGALKVLTSITMILAILIAGIVYAVKLFFSYRHTHNRHMLHVTRRLYYQTLANNQGVLLRLMDEAEQQAMCEAMLLICILEKSLPAAKSPQELDQECEELLNILGFGAIDFDIERTLRFLASERIVSVCPEGWRLA
jgi:hypothetical protein